MTTITSAADIKEEFGYRLEKELNRLGVTCFAYFVKSKNGNNRKPLVISNYPNEWIEQYFEDNLYRHDPVIHYGLHRVTPYSWSEARDHGNTQANDAVFRLSRTYDIESGFTFPLHDPTNRFVALSLCNRDQDPDFSRIVTRAMTPLMMLFLNTHDALATLMPPPEPEPEQVAFFEGNKICFQLTRRETDVLRWASQGKTYPEISIILGISVRTVKFHIENIVKKLDVSNAKHAIYKALHYDLI